MQCCKRRLCMRRVALKFLSPNFGLLFFQIYGKLNLEIFLWRHRLVWFRTQAFQAWYAGSNPAGATDLLVAEQALGTRVQIPLEPQLTKLCILIF